MSAARQKPAILLLALGIILGVAPVDLGWPAAAGAVVVDPQTGLAINGFDPVAYFTGEGAVQGREQYEYRQAGAMWRFTNEGNRAAFIDHPDVYAPQFGGYDPVAIGRGVSVAGNPMNWAVVGERLYLFHDAKARADFVEAPRRAIESAHRQWPDVKRTLP